MAENKPIVVEFHWTLAYSLLECVRCHLNEQQSLISKLVSAIDQHGHRRVEKVSLSFSDDDTGREDLGKFRFIVGILASSFTQLEGKLLSL